MNERAPHVGGACVTCRECYHATTLVALGAGTGIATPKI